MDENELLEPSTFRDRISNITEDGSRKWIYALKPKGNWYKYRIIFAVLYLIAFFAMPFIKVNDMPFILLNVVEGKFILFSKIFWPQDFFIFAVGMITFIIFIVLFTVIYGRLFCGWVCPQTVFLELVFRPIEWLIEGTPNQQKKRNEGPWNTDKIVRKTIKHVIYFLISFLIAHTFLAYILGIDEVYRLIREPLSGHLSLFVGLIAFTLLFYGVFAFVREIVCTTICPYGRLQGVMFDKNTMQISYDYKRGEPRGKFKKNVERTDGDCVNCFKCVQVCPTGIDIRNGVQLDCVGCTACIDACDEVMDSLHMDRGLIRYASENQIITGLPFQFTNRVKAYTALLIGLMLGMGVLIWNRRSVDTFISRVKGQTYQETEVGKISNLFEAKVLNKTIKDKKIRFALEDHQGNFRFIGTDTLIAKKEMINDFTFFLDLPKEEISERSSNLKISVFADEEKVQTIKTKFLGPFK
jgi:cytochrome c oxidase accessory protein FixG